MGALQQAFYCARGCLVVFLLVTAATGGTIVILTPVLPLYLWAYPWFLAYAQPFVALNMLFVADLFHSVLGYRPRMVSDGASTADMTTDENAIIIVNHRSQLDWFHFFDLVNRRRKAPFGTRVVLKNSLMQVPGLGWSLHMMGFAFLARFWDHDRTVLERCVDTATKGGSRPGWVVLYPEGTTLQAKSLARSQAWQTQHGKQLWNFCLVPRHRGFVHILRQFKHPPAVYDLTLAYASLRRGTRRPQPADIFNGRTPRAHFHFRRFAPDEYPSSGTDEQVIAWLHERFADKEARLKQFYEGPAPSTSPEGGFPGQVHAVQPTSPWIRIPNAVCWTAFAFGQFFALYHSSLLRTVYLVMGPVYAGSAFYLSRARSTKKF